MRPLPSLKARRSPKIWALAAASLVGAAAVLIADLIQLLPLLQVFEITVAYLALRALLAAVLCIAGLILGRRWAREEAALRRMTVTDGLTGVYNSAAWAQTLADGLPGETVGVIFWDVNGLKAVNDAHGHDAGDRLLRRMADSVRAIAGPEDLVFRTGGDEFVLVASGVDRNGLSARFVQWELILSRLNRDEALPLSVAAGFAIGPGDTLSELVHSADMDMYKNKP